MFEPLHEARMRLATAEGPKDFVDGFVEGAKWGRDVGSSKNLIFKKLCCELLEATTTERRIEILSEMRKKADCED